MGRQSSRLIYNGKDHKDIYFQGHYHDAMYVGSQLVWKKIRERNWERIGFHTFKDNGNAYIAYDAQDKLYYFDRDSKEWVLSEVPDVEISIGCAENGLFIANEYINDESMFNPSMHDTERIFISRDGKSWQNVGYIKETRYFSNSIVFRFATDGTNIVALPYFDNCHIHYGTIASSGEWERSEYVIGDIHPGSTSECGGFLLTYDFSNNSQTAHKSFDMGRTWTSFDISETGFFVDSVNNTPNFVGGKIFMIVRDSERNYFLSIVNPNNGFPEKVLEASPGTNYPFKSVIIDNRSGLFGFSNGNGFYQSKDGYTWEKVEQNLAYQVANYTIFIPNVGCFMSRHRAYGGYGQFCENPFDRYV